MARIRIKTDKVDIKIADIKPNEFTGAWQWVMDVLEIMNGGKTEEALKEIEDDMPFDAFNFTGREIKVNSAAVIDDFKLSMKADTREDILEWDKYDLYNLRNAKDASETFDRICDDFLKMNKSYLPRTAAELTGKICARFFYEQGKK